MAKKLAASEAILGNEGMIKREETRGRKAFLDPDERKSAQTTILLRPTTKENLKELAWRNRISMNELICQVLEEYLEKNFIE